MPNSKVCHASKVLDLHIILQCKITRIGEDLLKLGILHGTSGDEASIDEQPEMMTFGSKLFQEYWAAYYTSKRLGSSTSKV